MRRTAASTGGAGMMPRGLVGAAVVAYGANCALGASVATGLVDTSRSRWVHHALYIVTCATSAAAVVGSLRPGTGGGLALLPAAVPLALLPRVGRARHPAVALSAAPFFLAALVKAWR